MAAFKENLSAAQVAMLADGLERHLPGFDRPRFEALIPRLDPLELRQRVDVLADALATVLPSAPDRLAAVVDGLLARDSHGADTAALDGWIVWPLSMAVARCGADTPDRTLDLMRRITPRFSCEFAIRSFLETDLPGTLAVLSGWLGDPDPHVRRLISEGTRPRLPWAARLPALIADPAPVLPLLRALRDDPSDYVRRSVANHLGDIAKDHPDLALDLAEDWLRDAPATRRALIRHALRVPVKAGNPRALALLGHQAPRIDAGAPAVTPTQIALGDTLDIRCDIRSTADGPQALAVDIVLWFLKADGSRKPKVFKGVTATLAAGETLAFRKRLPLKPVTTRRHYAGEQAVALRINGQDTASTPFTLRL